MQWAKELVFWDKNPLKYILKISLIMPFALSKSALQKRNFFNKIIAPDITNISSVYRLP